MNHWRRLYMEQAIQLEEARDFIVKYSPFITCPTNELRVALGLRRIGEPLPTPPPRRRWWFRNDWGDNG